MMQQGNLDAFDLIFEKYKNEAVRTAYLITGRNSICEDIAQEAFIKCFKHIIFKLKVILITGIKKGIVCI